MQWPAVTFAKISDGGGGGLLQALTCVDSVRNGDAHQVCHLHQAATRTCFGLAKADASFSRKECMPSCGHNGFAWHAAQPPILLST